MLIVSQNLTNYDVELPKDTIYRINLAWINDLETLKNILEKHKEHRIFIDLPKNRMKPPNNKYSMDQLKPILQNFSNIKYFAISNVDSGKDLTEFLEYLPKDIIIVPKIESSTGIKNIEEISKLIGQEKGLSFDLVKQALEKKIHVVTGNKAMLALHGSELFFVSDITTFF